MKQKKQYSIASKKRKKQNAIAQDAVTRGATGALCWIINTKDLEEFKKNKKRKKMKNNQDQSQVYCKKCNCQIYENRFCGCLKVIEIETGSGNYNYHYVLANSKEEAERIIFNTLEMTEDEFNEKFGGLFLYVHYLGCLDRPGYENLKSFIDEEKENKTKELKIIKMLHRKIILLDRAILAKGSHAQKPEVIEIGEFVLINAEIPNIMTGDEAYLFMLRDRRVAYQEILQLMERVYADELYRIKYDSENMKIQTEKKIRQEILQARKNDDE